MSLGCGFSWLGNAALFPSHFLQLFLGDPETTPGQIEHVIPPKCSVCVLGSQLNTCLEFLQETSWSVAWSPPQASFHVKEQLLFSELPLDFRASNGVPKAGHPVKEIHLSPFLSGISFIRSLPTACEHRWGLELRPTCKKPSFVNHTPGYLSLWDSNCFPRHYSAVQKVPVRLCELP